jgi:hypothetical protein
MRFENAGGLAKTLALLIAILSALPLCALFVMLVTHALWGATAIDEMHEAVAYFALGIGRLSRRDGGCREQYLRRRPPSQHVWPQPASTLRAC